MGRFFKSWKTSLAGLGLLLSGASSIASGDMQTGVAQIVAGLGLLAAKDADKSHTQD